MAAGAALLPGRLTRGKAAGAGLRAGAAVVDISPKTLPVIVNGSFLERTASRVAEPIYARCLVLESGGTRIALAVVDLIAMPREMLDAVKKTVAASTGIPTSHILISAIHTHSAPAVIGGLGSSADEVYSRYFPPLLVQAIGAAAKRLEPARVGWAVARAPEHTNCRRWIYRSDRIGTDPFGERTVHANMHPGHQNPNCIGPAGPIDPDLTVLSVQARDGRPIALLANYSMHYYGAGAVSADYFGLFCNAFARLIGAEKLDPPFVAMMSHGTSGDLQWMDYGKPRGGLGRQGYAEALARKAHEACKTIAYHDAVPIAMAQRKLRLKRRVPDEKRLAWAKAIMATMGGRKPRNKPEVYAREAVYLHEEPERELILQALRIGGLGITAIPNEVYGLTGLRLKALSPLAPTMNIELANGSEGYIPPPEQHALGGYNSWPARSAGLEVQAEPRIVEVLVSLLEEVSGKPRRKPVDVHGPYAEAVLASKPAAYWRMNEFGGPRAVDASPSGHDGRFEGLVAFYLDGPQSPAFSGKQRNRAPTFAGGRLKGTLPKLGSAYTVELWLWNGMPETARVVTGYFFSRGPDGDARCPGDHLGVGGKAGATGRLFFYNGDVHRESLEGATRIAFRTWHHVALVRDGKAVRIYLDGNPTAEVASEAAVSLPAGAKDVFIGGRSDSFANFEGKIDEVAIYDRALSADEIARHYQAAAMKG